MIIAAAEKSSPRVMADVPECFSKPSTIIDFAAVEVSLGRRWCR
jgi:hypothetical protein